MPSKSVVGSLIPNVSRAIGYCPLSFAQQRLWFLDQLEPNNPLYNIPWTSPRQRRSLNVTALEQSLNTIIERHEALRTTFRSSQGRPEQVIGSTATDVRAAFSISVLFPKQRETETTRHIAEEANRPFDLGRGPLMRAILLRIAEDESHPAAEYSSYRQRSLVDGSALAGTCGALRCNC